MVCTLFWKEEYPLIKWIVKNTTAWTSEMHYKKVIYCSMHTRCVAICTAQTRPFRVQRALSMRGTHTASDSTRRSLNTTHWFRTCTVVFFKCLGSRHIHEEFRLKGGITWIDNILCRTDLKGFYHRRLFAVCLQRDPESYEWGLSVRSVDLKWNP